MLPPAFSDTPDSIEAREYEQLIQDGITAVKNNELLQARHLLEKAALINDTDSRIWIWLSATTQDLAERRTYLERAVAIDPSNAMAKRGLLMLENKLDKPAAQPEATLQAPQETPPTEEATAKIYTCPNCGASISYDIHETKLVCQFCGFTGKVDQHVIDESTELLLDTALPTERAHRWAESQSRLTCEQCGVVILLPPGQTADSCPYCASNRFITSASLMELVDPQVIGLFMVDPEKASDTFKTWLGKGFFAPDDLAVRHSGMQLHPAYYPFWIFEGTLEIPYFYESNTGTSRLPVWDTRSGSHFENFKDVIIPGLRKLPPAELAGIEPFKLDELVEFSPDFLAGWMALTYDLSLADASLKAREKVFKKVEPNLSSEVEPNHTKRNFSTGAGKWSGLTYKLALLPIYIGNYPFQGKRYRVLVNGQTGKVSGKKPVDTIKISMSAVGGLIMLVIVAVILWVLLRMVLG